MKLWSLQYLRAIAATGVVLTHASGSLFDGEHEVIPFGIGNTGVDLFFVISGFIMFYTTANNIVTQQDFYARRIIRIVPLYFLLTTAVFLPALMWPDVFRAYSTNYSDYIKSILFIPFYNNKLNSISPVLSQGWTLNFEIFFYLIFGIVLFCRPLTRLMSCAAIFLLLPIVGLMLPFSNTLIDTYTDSIMIEFIFGMLIGYFVLAGEASRFGFKFMVIAISVAGAIMMAVDVGVPFGRASAFPRFMYAGVPAAAFVAIALWCERIGRIPKIPMLLLVGDVSYSLYLSHVFVLAVLRRICQRLFDVNLVITNVLFMAASVAMAVLVSIILYKRLEHPITTWLMANTKNLRLRQAPL